MNKHILRRLALPVGVVLAATTVVIIWAGISRIRSEAAFVGGFDRVDALIADGRIDDAVNALVPMRAAARTRSRLLSLLKRYQLIRAMGAPGADDAFASFAAEAADRLPGSPELAAVAAYASIDRPETAARFAERITGDQLEPVKAWAYLRAGRADQLEGLENPVAIVARLAAADEASADDFAAAYGRTGDTRLGVDAALLAATDGDFRRAVALLPEEAETSLRVRLLREAGIVEEARQILATRQVLDTSDLALWADLALLSGRIGEASRLYQDIIDIAPEAYPQAYANLARLQGTGGEETLRAGVALFPGNHILLEELGRLLAARGQTVEALALVAEVEEVGPEPRLALLSLDLSSPSGTLRERRLRELLALYPESSLVAERLMAHYYIQDDVRIDRLIERFSHTAAAHTFSGLRSVDAGGREAANTAFERAWELGPAWYTGFNRGLSLGLTGNLAEAEHALRSASLFTQDESDQIRLSAYQMRFLIALGRLERAAAVYQRAQNLRPGDPLVVAMRRELDAAGRQ